MKDEEIIYYTTREYMELEEEIRKFFVSYNGIKDNDYYNFLNLYTYPKPLVKKFKDELLYKTKLTMDIIIKKQKNKKFKSKNKYDTTERKMETILKEDQNKQISCSKDIYNILLKYFTEEREEVYFIGVNTKNKIKHIELIGIGGLNFSNIDTRIIYKRMFEKNLNGFFLAHNHPSGDTTPSQNDLNITEKINDQCKILDLKFMDHIIFCEKEYYSLFDHDKGGF